MKHNKKRNTAFLYETLVRELTATVVNKDTARKRKIVSIMKEFFSRGTTLGLELELYRTLYETTEVDEMTAEKLLLEVKRVYLGLSQQHVFDQQSTRWMLYNGNGYGRSGFGLAMQSSERVAAKPSMSQPTALAD